MIRASMWPVVLSATVAVGLASDAHADAPPGQYDIFDEWDPTISDLKTGLMWERTPGPQMTFDAAAGYCQGLALTANSFWRVPSYKELLTLVDETPHTSYVGAVLPVAIDNHAFPGSYAPSGKYWSSSQNSFGAYYVDFMDGRAGYDDPGASFYVRCVSGPTGVGPAK